jgi:hypothetical protein
VAFAGSLYAVGFVVALGVAGLTLFLFLRERVTVRQLVFWETVSLGVAVLAAFPGLIEWLAGLIGVTQRGIFVLTMGVLGAYALVYYLSVYQRRNEKEIRRLNQEMALLRYQMEYGIGEPRDESRGDDSGPQ